jgi:hypothetical protein
MPSIDQRILAFADAISRPGPTPIRVPRPPQLSLHMGTIAAVDLGNNTVHWAFNGSDVVQGGIRFLQAYSDANPPQVGDVAWAQHNGTDLLVLGRHIIPNSTVILS